MKVLTIWMAGMSSHALARLTALSRKGVEVALLCARHWPEAGVQLSGAGLEVPFQVYPRATTLTGKGAYYMFVPGTSKVVSDFQPDLIHVREEMYTVFAGQFLSERRLRFPGVPFVFESWQNIRKRYPWPSRWFEATGYRQAAGAVAGTPPVEQVLRAGGFTGEVAVIPLGGIDTHTYTPTGPDMRVDLPEGPLVGYVGRLVPEKGIDLILEAAAKTASKFTPIIVGDGPEKAVLQAMASKLAPSAHFMGPVDHDRMPALLRSFDVLVLPSRTTDRWKEQWGRVLTEAMACGTPVVGSSSGEIPYVVGEAGRIFTEGSAEELTTVLDEILVGREVRQKMASDGVTRAAQFSWEMHAEKTHAFFRSVLAAHG